MTDTKRLMKIIDFVLREKMRAHKPFAVKDLIFFVGVSGGDLIECIWLLADERDHWEGMYKAAMKDIERLKK